MIPMPFMPPETLILEAKDAPATSGFTEAELYRIAEAASTIQERLGPQFEPVEGSAPDEKRLTRWCEVVAKGDWATFRKRLRWDGLDLEHARNAIRPARLRAAAPLPTWTATLNQCLTGIETAVLGSSERFYTSEAPLPFEHLLAPIVCVARGKVQRHFDGSTIPVTANALGDLERHLLVQLSTLSAQALHVHFSVFKATSYSAWANPSYTAENAPADAAYQAFVAYMQAGEIRSFLQEYSVLSRKIATQVDNWVTNTVCFLERLCADWDALRQTFSNQNPGRIDHIECGMSDPHCGGQSTHILHCENGLRFVYKPKHLGLGIAFQHLIAWCNDHGLQPTLRPLRLLGRPGYGWVEYINTQTCTSSTEVAHYFRRAGTLLALAYLLNGKDLHHRNVIACGAQPMFIDLEMFMVPSVMEPPTTAEPESSIDYEEGVGLEDSVLGTMLLPRWIVDTSRPGDVIVRNVAGFANETRQTYHLSRWTNINTDRMRMATIREEVELGDNVPRLNGEMLHSSDYVEDIQQGFERAYRIIREHADDLLQKDGVLSVFAEQPIRFVVRSTPIYGKLLRGLQHPRYLRNGLDASIELEALVRGYLHFETRPPYWPIIEAEQQDLANDDVPLFKTFTTSTALFDANKQVLRSFFEAPGLEAVKKRVRTLDEDDLRFQKDLIWTSFYTQQANNDLSAKASAAPLLEHPPAQTDPLLRDEAHRILERLRRTAIRREQGGLSWITFANSAPSVKGYQVRHIGHDLHYGRCGLALFLAACHRAGGQEVGAMLQDTLRPLTNHLQDETQREALAREHTIGGTYGLGSYVYALTQIGALMDDEKALEWARVVASLISEEAIEKDQRFDIVFGASGAALGLLALYRSTGDEEVLAKANRCGEHLLRNQEVEPESGCRTWRTLHGEFKTGFSHGAAGIAHALAELYRATDNPAYLEAALEAFAFERSLLMPEINNWTPHRTYLETTGDSDTLWSTWCRGATGIGLARLANLDLFSEAEREEVEIAIKATKAHLLRGVDHLCCGVMGRVAFLMAAAQTLQRPDLAQAARSAASSVVARAQNRNTYNLAQGGPDTLRPGLFQGLSGIGYQLIKLASKETFPAILLLR